MTIFQTFVLCVILIIFLSSGCYCLWNGAYLLFNYLKPDFLSNPRFAYIHHRKGKLPIPAIALIRMFLGLPLLGGFWFFLAPSKWNCPECDTYQIAAKSGRYGDYYCINCMGARGFIIQDCRTFVLYVCHEARMYVEYCTCTPGGTPVPDHHPSQTKLVYKHAHIHQKSTFPKQRSPL